MKRNVRGIIAKIYIILVLLIFTTLIIYNIVSTNKLKNSINGYPVLTTEQGILGSMKEDMRDYVIVNAPLGGEVVVDTYGDLTQKYNVPLDKLLYVCYIEEEVESRRTDDGTEYYWDVKNRVEIPTNEFYIYDNIQMIGSLGNYTPIENIHTVIDYPTAKGSAKTYGNKRTILKYVTTEDTLTFIATVGNGVLIPENEVNHTYFYLNQDITGIMDNAGKKNFSNIFLLGFFGIFFMIIGIVLLSSNNES